MPESVYKDEKTLAAQARSVLDSAEVQGRKLLLVYDNVRDMNDVTALLPHPPARAIVTTRLDVDSPGWSRLDIDILDLPDAVELLRGLLGRDCVDPQRKAAEQLCDALVGHPLSLELAAGWLNHVEARKRDIMALVPSLWKKGVTSEALELPEKERAEHAERGLHECFEASWQDLSERGRMALMAASCFAPWDIPAGGMAATLNRPEVGLCEEEAQEAVAECVQLSLLRRSGIDQDRYHCHPLLHDYARRKACELASGRAAREAFVRYSIRFAQRLDVTNWCSAQPDIPHLSAAARVAPQTVGDEQASWPCTALGRYYECSGAYDLALEHASQAAAIAGSASGNKGTIYAASLTNMAHILTLLGEQQRAQECYEEALQIDLANHGANHPTVARDMSGLAIVLMELGDLPGAQRLLEEAAGIAEKAYGAADARVASVHNNLGYLFAKQGDLLGARREYEHALRIAVSACGQEHPSVATSLNNLGTVQKEQGDLAGARSSLERALKIKTAVYGADHPEVAVGLINLAIVLGAQGDLERERELQERALEIDIAVYGEEHPKVAADLNNLAITVHDLGDIDGARARHERALSILEKAFPSNHPRVQAVRSDLRRVLGELSQRGNK